MAARGVFGTLRQCINSFEEICSIALGLRYPHGPNVAAISAIGWKNSSPPAVPQNFDPFGLGDGFLWAVPKHRRTVERRLKRKFGSPGNWKIILPRKDLTVCRTCGDNHEIGILCGTCYKKVLHETKIAQDLVQEKLGLTAVDKEVVLLYENESTPSDANNKFIVEVPRPRPQWFSRNLLQRSTDSSTTSAVSAEPEAVSVAVKPSDLG